MKKNVIRVSKHGTILIYHGKELVGIVNVVPHDVVTIENDCTYEFVEDTDYLPELLSRLFM